MQRALSALQPTNLLHIGNLFGAVLPMVEAQQDYQTSLFIVDYHAITLPQEPQKLNEAILFAVASYIAAGADPAKTMIFQQSQVPQHTELAWILSCQSHMGELERMTQFKDKSKKQTEGITVGLFTYPVLMAADILLYDTTIVPVGEDQKQHVELTRDLAERFNNRFGKTFVIPEPRIREFGARIMGLDDVNKKMSKSAESPKNYISILDQPEVIQKKIMSAVTDSGLTIRYDKSRPAITNLMTIYSLLTKKTFKEIEMEFEGKGYGDFKKGLAEALINYLQPLQKTIHQLLQDPGELVAIVAKGSEQARELAEKKMIEVRKRLGVAL